VRTATWRNARSPTNRQLGVKPVRCNSPTLRDRGLLELPRK
jgi:hypothetical protein